MPFTLGPWELIIVLLIVVVIFGAGKLSEIGGALGRGIREFRTATKDEAQEEEAAKKASAAAATTTPVASTENRCPSCGSVNPQSQTFCGQCGTRLTRAA